MEAARKTHLNLRTSACRCPVSSTTVEVVGGQAAKGRSSRRPLPRRRSTETGASRGRPLILDLTVARSVCDAAGTPSPQVLAGASLTLCSDLKPRSSVDSDSTHPLGQFRALLEAGIMRTSARLPVSTSSP